SQSWVIDIGAVDRDRVRIDQQLVRVEPIAACRIVKAVSTQPVARADPHALDLRHEQAFAHGARLDTAHLDLADQYRDEYPLRRPAAYGKAHAAVDDSRAESRLDQIGSQAHQVMTVGLLRPVCFLMPAISSAAAIRSASACCVSSPCLAGSAS